MCDTDDRILSAFPVRVYVTDISRPETFYYRWYDAMPQERRERADRFRMEADKKRCIMAYALLTKAVNELAANLGMEDEWGLTTGQDGMTEELSMTYNSDGKPYFENIPVHFNISHAGERVMVALSPRPVGCDVEHKSKDALNIAKRFFTGCEYEALLGVTDETKRLHEFTRLWTLKESVVKCCGEGIRHSFNDFSLLDNEGEHKSIIKLNSENDTYHIREFPGENGYCYSCCSAYGRFEDELRRWYEA